MEEEKRTDRRAENRKKTHRRKYILKQFMIRCMIGGIALLVGIGTGWILRGMTIRKSIDLGAIKIPEWVDEQFITINPYSRPGTKLSAVNNIVIHYVGNPGTTAQQNRDYFEGLKHQNGSNIISVSSNFVIGMDGEIIECIPVDEKSYASNNRNGDTISIECCHPDSDGKFTKETYDSLVKLTAWLCYELDLGANDVIRHYDVTGKECPRSFVENPNEWKQFRKDVRKTLRKLK